MGKLSEFTLMQTFNLTPFSNDELDKLGSEMLELNRFSFQHMKKVMKQIDEKYTFIMPYWLLIIIKILGTTEAIIIVSIIWYLKYCKASGKVRHPLT